MANHFQKLELDVFAQNSLQEASDFCIAHGCPAIVVPHALYSQAFMLRGIRNGRYKLVTTIDWPNGLQYKDIKFRGVPAECMSADSFEVMVTPGDSGKILSEITYLSKLIRDNFPPTCGLRLVLGLGNAGRTDQHIIDICSAVKRIPSPELIRTTNAMHIENAEAAHDRYVNQVNFIRTHCNSVPIKVCGAVNLATYTASQFDKFAVTYKCAVDIANSHQNLHLKKGPSNALLKKN